jgi:hypothetical protein
MTLRYGIDAPFWVGTLITVGFVFSLISITGLPQSIGGLIFGLFLLCMGLWMFFYPTAIIKIKSISRHLFHVKAHSLTGAPNKKPAQCRHYRRRRKIGTHSDIEATMTSASPCLASLYASIKMVRQPSRRAGRMSFSKLSPMLIISSYWI